MSEEPAKEGAAQKAQGQEKKPDLLVTITHLHDKTELSATDPATLTFTLPVNVNLVVKGTVASRVDGKKVKPKLTFVPTGIIFSKQHPRNPAKRVVHELATVDEDEWTLTFLRTQLNSAGLLGVEAMLVVHAQSSTDQGKGASGPFQANPS